MKDTDAPSPKPESERVRIPCVESGRHIYAKGKCQNCGTPESARVEPFGAAWRLADKPLDIKAADPRSSPPSPETPFDLEQRFELKAAVIRLREASAIRGSGHIWPTDVIAVLDELDRLMLVNGQIAHLRAEAEDRSPRSSLTAPTELKEEKP